MKMFQWEVWHEDKLVGKTDPFSELDKHENWIRNQRLEIMGPIHAEAREFEFRLTKFEGI